MRLPVFVLALVSLAIGANAYWMQDIKHQGLASFAGSGYTVFRNVKDFGAVGDGTTDDTQAILSAMNAGGNRCLQGCASTTTTPAVVYFPGGTYLVSSSIVTPYMTQMIGDPTNRPVLKASANFAGFGIIDGTPYYTDKPNWVATNVFFRQVANFVLDTTSIAPGTAATGMHWASSQATSLTNLEFNMPAGANSVHVGLFLEEGSGGFMSDLTFNGGATGATVGSQQYTMRNFTFNNCQTAIILLWDWTWTFMGLSINNCNVGIDMSAPADNGGLNVGSCTVIDSTFTNVGTAIKTARNASTTPATANGLMIENVVLVSTPIAVGNTDGSAILQGGSTTIAAWGQGNSYTPNGPTTFQGAFTANNRPAVLLDGNRYYTQSKPTYSDLAVGDFLSARDAGATGDGVTDDTAAIQSVITQAAAAGKVVYLDYGEYVVTDTIVVPPGAKIFGESFPVIMGSGAKFQDMNNPAVVFSIGASAGQAGSVDLTNMIVSTKGPAPGAIIIEYNLAAAAGSPSHFWDVHTRIGGYAGSEFQVAQCVKAPGSANVDPDCIAAFMAVHAVPASSGLYMENTWVWSADHDIEDATNTQITIYSGRGIYIESTNGPTWLIGGAAEHFHLYNYQFANTKNIFASMLQTETPYYQPIPDATTVFPPVTALTDPVFSAGGETWGLRIVDASDLFLYGSVHYSFFNNYDLTCNTFASGSNCQSRIVSIEGSVSDLNIYSLNTVGTLNMVTRDGTDLAKYSDNVNTFAASIQLFRTG